MSLPIPRSLESLRAEDPAAGPWLDRLPRLASDVLAQWELTPDGAPFDAAYALVVPVRTREGGRRVLKLAVPGEDGAGEIPALKAWNGDGAARLERADPRRGILLLERLGERCLDSLGAVEACGIVGGLYGRLHRPAPPTLPGLAVAVGRWVDELEGLGPAVPAPPRMVARAVDLGRRLLADGDSSDDAARVVHGDLHGGNVLEGELEPWQVIDPKGYAGDPAYEPAPLLWNRWSEVVAAHRTPAAVLSRFYAVVDASGLDEERARDWVVVRAMIHAGWEVTAARTTGRKLGADARERLTRYITVAKAMDEVTGGAW